MLGVIAFSFTLPLTRVAVAGGLSPLFVGAGRAVVAALLAVVALRATRQQLPSATQALRLAVVAGGAVAGFPLLTSYALERVPATHGAVVIALLPAVTAVVAVLRTGERPGRRFWIAAAAGAIAALAFAGLQGGVAGFGSADLLLFAAVAVCAIAYAEGGLLARELGSWQTIAWALVLASPVMLLLSGVAIAAPPPVAPLTAWAAFAYLGVVSMFLGFVAWYRGLSIGPMAQVSQVQLAQPVMTICWSAVILGEPITIATIAGGAAVIACALIAVRARTGAATGSGRGPRVTNPRTMTTDADRSARGIR